MGTGICLFCTLKMGFTALRLGFKHCGRKKRFLQWDLDFFPFTILFDTIAQMCLFKLKEIKFCTSRPQQTHRIMPVLYFAFASTFVHDRVQKGAWNQKILPRRGDLPIMQQKCLMWTIMNPVTSKKRRLYFGLLRNRWKCSEEVNHVPCSSE